MGEHARRVADRLRECLTTVHPGFDWTTEYGVGRTAVDVGGVRVREGSAAVGGPDREIRLVELEWRRADPSNNAAKLFRALVEGTCGIDREREPADESSGSGTDLALDADRVVVVQLFTGYYNLSSGGYSTKRLTAEFVGERVARTVDRADYRAVTLPVDPPKRGGELPDGWREAVDGAARELFA
jgi:hypothetical protein